MFTSPSNETIKVLKEVSEKYGKTTLVIEFKNIITKTEALNLEIKRAEDKIRSDFEYYNTQPIDYSYCEKSESLDNKLTAIAKRISRLEVVLALAETNYNFCANNAYRTTNCQSEINNYNKYNQQLSSEILTYDRTYKNYKIYSDKCKAHITKYEYNAKKAQRDIDKKRQEYENQFIALNNRLASITDELEAAMEGHPYQYESLYGNGNLKSAGTLLYNKNIRTGVWKYYYENRKLKNTGEFRNDKQSGVWKTYNTNGALIQESTYEFDEKTGSSKTYYENGTMNTLGKFKNNLQEGLWKYYYENGTMKALGKYKNNSQEGLWKYYHENGKLRTMGMCKAGKEVGLWKTYNENGVLKR